ncbi:cation:proton antiporter domain-containing protein [Amycolatopsis sp. TRM77291]
MILYATCHLTHANPYLAAFAAGATLATMDRVSAEHFEHLGDLLSETTKCAALLVFGALITPERLSHLSVGDWAVAVIAIVLVRPAAMMLSLFRTQLPVRERSVAAWFGPKGFASVVYGLLALQAGIPEGEHVFDLVAITIALSIVLHSSTDVPGRQGTAHRTTGQSAHRPTGKAAAEREFLMGGVTPAWCSRCSFPRCSAGCWVELQCAYRSLD